MNHLQILDGLRSKAGGVESPSLAIKAAGKFYTPRRIADRLIPRIVSAIEARRADLLRIIDPFCGDGRLIEWLLCDAAGALVNTRVEVSLWDYDESAVRVASRRVRAAGERHGIDLQVAVFVGDTFRHATSKFGAYDVVLTNPPWDRLKPDRRETGALGRSGAAYVAALREQDDFIVTHYPLSQPSLKFSGWGTNLARVGAEVALRLSGPGGICGVISPATLFADQVSAPLRQWLFETYRISTIDLFPAELKLFAGVDQPVAVFVAHAEPGRAVEPTVFHHKVDGAATTERVIRLDTGSAEHLGYRLPLHGGGAVEQLFERLRDLPRLGDTEGEGNDGLWAGRELDETGYHSYLGGRGKYEFIKGRLVERYSIKPSPYGFVAKNGPRIPKSADHKRIVWRDVSRPTQQRRLIATIVPPLTVAGNSLSVCYYLDDDSQRLRALLGVMNSYVFEFQIRAHLATAHVSLGAVRKGHLPDLSAGRTATRIAALVDLCLEGDASAMDRVEVAAAKAYGLKRSDFTELLLSFPRVEHNTVRRLTAAALW